MKQNVLFLPAAIKSHIIPALFLASMLEEKYDVWFAVSDKVLEKLVKDNGYSACITSNYRMAVGMEGRFVFEQKRKNGKWPILLAVWKNELSKFRQQELYDIIHQVNPVLIVVDIYNSTDLLAIFPLIGQPQLLYFNPMLSTFRVDGFPVIYENRWPVKDNLHTTPMPDKMTLLKQFFTRPFETLLDFSIRRQFKRLYLEQGFSSNYPIAENMTRALLFENIPELILAPNELELSPMVRKAHQHYLGLCIRDDRKDTELDGTFKNQFNNIVSLRLSGRKLIYCSFGTFYRGPDRNLLSFLNRLIDALEEISEVEVIFSVNKFVIETLRHQRDLGQNLHMFSRVPQLEVLKFANVFITHGGLGSIKESIRYAVPMLVYPLDLQYDQNGNALKIEYHGLGLRGEFATERSRDMKQKITLLLQEEKYKETISTFRDTVDKAYSKEKLHNLIHQLIA